MNPWGNDPAAVVRKRRHLKLPKRVRYPIWSVKTVAINAIIVTALTAGLVFFIGERSFFTDTELTLGIIAVALFTFLTVGLYHGVRVKRRDVPGTDFEPITVQDISDKTQEGWDLPLDAIDLGSVGESGCLGAIAALVLAVVGVVVAIFLLWLLLNLWLYLWVFIVAALAWLFHLALRQVFAKSRICQGKWGPSLKYAAFYTLLYTGWLLAVVVIADGVYGHQLQKNVQNHDTFQTP